MSVALVSLMSASGPVGQVCGSPHLVLNIVIEKPNIDKHAHNQHAHTCTNV